MSQEEQQQKTRTYQVNFLRIGNLPNAVFYRTISNLRIEVLPGNMRLQSLVFQDTRPALAQRVSRGKGCVYERIIEVEPERIDDAHCAHSKLFYREKSSAKKMSVPPKHTDVYSLDNRFIQPSLAEALAQCSKQCKSSQSSFFFALTT